MIGGEGNLGASEIDRFLVAAEAAADVAGTVLRPLFRQRLAADIKSDNSPVTIADQNAEQAIRSVLGECTPDFGIIGEEYGRKRLTGGLCWVIDPIDGTRAFLTGRPSFGTLIALFNGDAPVLGVIDQPITGERWIGITGRPTLFRGGLGGVAGCRRCPRLADAELSCTSPQMFGPLLPRWERLRDATCRVTFGGDCYAYGLLALGHVDVIAEADLKVWDWAALLPVIEGAGGRMTDWEGRPLRPDGEGRALAVGDPALLLQAVRALAR